MKTHNTVKTHNTRGLLSRPEVMRLVQRLGYVGTEALSPSQLRTRRREAVERFVVRLQETPDWENRMDELWRYFGDDDFKVG